MKAALICGITGQDGYLARLLLDRGYEVVGTSRDAQMSSFANLDRLGIRHRVRVVSMAINDFRSVFQILNQVRPDEVYNLAGLSSVALSFEQPVEALESITVGTPQSGREHPLPRLGNSFLQRRIQRVLWRYRGTGGRREHPFPSAQRLRRSQGGGILGDGQLPRGLRPVCLHGHPVQPRIAPAA